MRGVGLAGLLGFAGFGGLGLEVLVGRFGLLVVVGAVVVALAVESLEPVVDAVVDVDVEFETVVLSVASVVAAEVELSTVDCDSDNKEILRIIKQM